MSGFSQNTLHVRTGKVQWRTRPLLWCCWLISSSNKALSIPYCHPRHLGISPAIYLLDWEKGEILQEKWEKEKYIFERLCNLAPGCRKSNRAAKKRRQSRPNPFTGSVWLCTALGSLLRMNLILSACSIRSRFLYSVYLFCLGFPESRRQTARLTLILRSQKNRIRVWIIPHFFGNI